MQKTFRFHVFTVIFLWHAFLFFSFFFNHGQIALGHAQDTVPFGLEINQQVRFIDSMTGCTVYPEMVLIKETTRETPSFYKRAVSREEARVEFEGGVSLSLTTGSYEYTVEAPGYRTMKTSLDFFSHTPQRIEFHLDPVKPPPELEPKFIKTLHSPDSTVILGFVVDDETGQPLSGTRVGISGDTPAARTNERGFFILHIPVPRDFEDMSTAHILIEKDGYRSEERRYIELWPKGDWIYRIRLLPGQGIKVVDERDFRRK